MLLVQAVLQDWEAAKGLGPSVNGMTFGGAALVTTVLLAMQSQGQMPTWATRLRRGA